MSTESQDHSSSDVQYRWSWQTVFHLLGLSLFATINESAFQFALIIELAFITNFLPTNSVAAYAAVVATTTFALNVFNFLLVTTLAQVGKAVGAKNWGKIGPRFRLALLTAMILGASAAGLLLALQKPIFTHLMTLSQPVVAEVGKVFKIRLVLLPLMMVQRVCVGLLGGYQRIRVLAFQSLFIAALEVLSQWVALRILNLGLVGATWASVVTALAGALLSLLLVVWLPPKDARGRIMLCGCGTERETQSSNLSVICDFATGSCNTVVRSLLLTASIYTMSIMAAKLGTSTLAAHQVAVTLWMLMSLICDGLADVGTILGSKLVGVGGRMREFAVIRDILLLMGLALGIIAAAVMFFLRDDILRLFNLGSTSQDLLLSLWPLLCCMQVVNAAVFVFDGFIYAVQAFRFVRNLMILGCLGVFGPTMAVAMAIHKWRSLLAIWVAKTGLNVVRALGAFWLLYWRLPRKWDEAETRDMRGELDRGRSSDANAHRTASLTSPLI